MKTPLDELLLLAGEYGLAVQPRAGRLYLLNEETGDSFPATTNAEGLVILRMTLRREAQVQGYPRGAA